MLGLVQLWKILPISFLAAVVQAFDAPARQAMLPDYDDHWGCLSHPLFEPSRLPYDREGSSSGIAEAIVLCLLTGLQRGPMQVTCDVGWPQRARVASFRSRLR